MSEFEYKDHLPANARVIIDYKGKERVKFSYPRKRTYWKAVWCCAYQTIFSFWVYVNIKIIICLVLGLLPLFFLILLRNLSYLTSSLKPATLQDPQQVIFSLLMFFYVFGIPTIATYILAKKPELLSKVVPKLGYFNSKLMSSIKEKVFTKKDIFRNKAVIPIFRNVFLNYECSGDFKRYLEKVEILELPFNYMTTGFFLPHKNKKTKNESLFRAMFYFSNKIKEGEMKVLFD